MRTIILETVNEFNIFLERSKEFDWIVVPVYCNGDRPVYAESISVIYIYVLQLDEEVMVVFNHTEGLSLSEKLLNSFPTDTKMFVYNKKKFKRFLDRPNLIDMSMVNYFHNNLPIEDDFETPAHEFFTRNFSEFTNLNTIIPIVKHIEKSQLIVQRFLDIYDYFHYDEAFKSYNDIIIDSLYQIETSGLFSNSTLYSKKFEKSKLYDNFAYTEYNPYTTTGRPSNRFGGVNFAALKKDDGSRLPFVSRFGENGFMMSFDYDAYHLRLLAELVDYKFPEDISVHKYLGQFYFKKTDLLPDEYQASKSISFRQLYGGIQEDYLEIPFFAKISQYTKLLWERYREDGFIETPYFGRKLFNAYFTDMNSAKLLNYLLQSYETERNMACLHNLFLEIKSYKSKIILYTYDSILIDFHKDDSKEFILKVSEILVQGGKFPIKVEVGPNYSEMKQVRIF